MSEQIWMLCGFFPFISSDCQLSSLFEEEWSDNKFMADYLKWNLKLLSYPELLDAQQLLSAEAAFVGFVNLHLWNHVLELCDSNNTVFSMAAI